MVGSYIDKEAGEEKETADTDPLLDHAGSEPAGSNAEADFAQFQSFAVMDDETEIEYVNMC